MARSEKELKLTDSPWGRPQTIDVIAPGIAFVSTSSHGGFKVSEDRNVGIPAFMRRKDGWYEEDVEAAIVISVFADDFSQDEVRTALNTLRTWFPDEYERFTGETLPIGASRVKDERAFYKAHANDYLVMTAWGDWHQSVPSGFVSVFAGRGGRTRTGGFPKDTAYFLIPEAEYDARSDPAFIVNPSRHEEVEPIA